MDVVVTFSEKMPGICKQQGNVAVLVNEPRTSMRPEVS